MSVGQSVKRVDAKDKVCGTAKYTADFFTGDMLCAKILHSTIANGQVKNIDISEAKKLSGVVKIVTCFDVPDIVFPTAGHPWSTDPAHQDVADRKLLNSRVRLYGDDIAAVIAKNELICEKALKLIKVEYEEYPPFLNVFDAMSENATQLHEGFAKNILKHTNYELGDFDQAVKEEGLQFLESEYSTQVVQHCHIEPPVSYAYMEKDRIVIVSSTQIPHIVRRVVGQALGIPWGRIRVIKPYIGGGFGNKQEVLYEPLNAYLTMLVGGRYVKLEISREETFISTRTRHAMTFKIKSAFKEDGRLVARQLTAWSNQGGYASHGHAIIGNAANAFRQLYQDEKATKVDAYTVYTTQSTAGAMRGYGIPQINFAIESHIEDIANKLNMDSLEIRKKNCMREGFKDKFTGIKAYSDGIVECIELGKKVFKWDERLKNTLNQSGDVRRGIGVAIFNYKTGVYPISLETASARIILNQDGSVMVKMGATEIGQGADTVFTQMAAQTLSIPIDKVHIVSTQDTDITPFDTGAYASRQTYVSGTALRNTAEKLKIRIIDYAVKMTGRKHDTLDLVDGNIIDKESGNKILSLEEVAMESFYSLENSQHLTAESTHHCTNNTFAFGACFVEIEVDIPLGKIRIVDILNVHDSGILINPKLAEAQVHGGMSMGLGYVLSEQMLFDDKGVPLNNNLLDYKLPTSLDTPEFDVEFIQPHDPTGPYGNKALGEPPAIPQSAAVRNALLNATGIKINDLPLNPQKLVERFMEHGLIKKLPGVNE